MTRSFMRAVPITLWLGSLALASGCADIPPEADPAPVREARAFLHGTPNDQPIDGETSLDFVFDDAPVTHFSGYVRREAKQVLAGAPVAPEDLELTWQVTWSEAYLRLRINVRDDVLVSDSAQPWEDDSFEIYLDPDNSRGRTYDGINDYQLVFRLDDPTIYLGVSSASRVDGIQVSTSKSSTPYHVTEVKIPWTVLGVTPAAGRSIGIDVHANDDDDGGARDTKIAAGALRDDAWTDPTSFLPVRLGPAVTAPGSHRLLVLVRDAYTRHSIPGAEVSVGLGAGNTLASKTVDWTGSVAVGSCTGEEAPLSTPYSIGGYHVAVTAPHYAGARTYVFANPLLAWCSTVPLEIALFPEE